VLTGAGAWHGMAWHGMTPQMPLPHLCWTPDDHNVLYKMRLAKLANTGLSENVSEKGWGDVIA
jgi:hypothetical protein